MKTKPKIIVILGQTSTGKSDFAVQIAKEVSGEIISADSRQVYKGMNLGAGKITKKEMKGIPHHLLDVASPSKIFTVSEFKKIADKKIEEIIKRGKTPVLCGGTGFYIDAVIDDIALPEVPPNKKLRESLENKTPLQLFAMLQKLDPTRAKNIDTQNKVRLVRAIEVAKAIGKVPQNPKKIERKYEVIKVGLTLPDKILKGKIKTRLLNRINKGMLREISNLHKQRLSWKRMEMLGLEYRYGALYLQKKISKDEMIEQICKQTWQYAKRQRTWFKRDKAILWVNSQEIHEKAKALKMIKVFLK
ncbi:MAG: tRNA (adenosine(37)-N6)-dimethylallyltransferase MiaA [Patescibacteria group bacterium]|nr:tRNA (adenosine(37)-N6)-dimethylallyltransferase MiaA [Patescibacteria group bacterium]